MGKENTKNRKEKDNKREKWRRRRREKRRGGRRQRKLLEEEEEENEKGKIWRAAVSLCSVDAVVSSQCSVDVCSVAVDYAAAVGQPIATWRRQLGR